MISIGTSGFSYDDWVGPFYPAGLPKREWLAFYAREFKTLEVNATYYGVPAPATMAGMAARTPTGFLFTVKAHQDMTHKREGNAAVFAAFLAAMSPLAEAGKLGCVLAQFPFSFHATTLNRDYLLEFQSRLGELPLVVEFRNAEWLNEATFNFLRAHQIGFCCVDEPRLPGLMPPVAVAISAVAYVRFHGRNSAKWWQHQQAYERYDYLYSPAELQEWLPKINDLASSAAQVYLFANNHWQAQAVDTARQLRLMLGQD
jgi:uncharacterized protein YecE (DUF72 family)